MARYYVQWKESCWSFVEADSAEEACTKARQATLGYDDEGIYANRVCGEESENFSAVIDDPIEKEVKKTVQGLMNQIKWQVTEHATNIPIATWDTIQEALFYEVRSTLEKGRMIA